MEVGQEQQKHLRNDCCRARKNKTSKDNATCLAAAITRISTICGGRKIHPGQIGKDSKGSYQKSGTFKALGIKGVRTIGGARPMLPHMSTIEDIIVGSIASRNKRGGDEGFWDF